MNEFGLTFRRIRIYNYFITTLKKKQCVQSSSTLRVYLSSLSPSDLSSAQFTLTLRSFPLTNPRLQVSEPGASRCLRLRRRIVR